MTREANWTAAEFERLLQAHDRANESLSEVLPGRTPDAIAVVRQGIHRYHAGQSNADILSKLMLSALATKRGTTVCPLCMTRF